jgi:uncharacterized protein
MTSSLDSSAFDRLEKLLVFPAVFPLKVMGLRVDNFAQEISTLVRTHIPDFDPSSIEMRSSSKGTYLSVTVNLNVSSRVQLETVYKAVSTHPLVKIVL